MCYLPAQVGLYSEKLCPWPIELQVVLKTLCTVFHNSNIPSNFVAMT